MSTKPLLQRVNPEDIRDNAPVPYDVFTADGALLLARGQVVTGRDYGMILRTQGWTPLEPGQEPLVGVLAPVETPEIRLPSRGRPPLHQAEALVADDMRLIRQLLVRLLREQGVLQVEAVDNGRKAITYFFRHRPHMVYLDIDMPGVDGLAVLKQIKQWCPDQFVCMISANSTLMNVKEAKACGVDAFLVKPLSPLNLKRVLNLYLNPPKPEW